VATGGEYIVDTLKDLESKTATLTSQTTKCLNYGIPTLYALEDVKQGVENVNPTVKLTSKNP
jgi:hypothetical protein